MSIAIFGGSFNPIHMGHFAIVKQINLQLQPDRIIVVPAYRNPLKSQRPALPDAIRMAMLQETFSGMSNIEISDLEIKSPNTSYTYKTLEALHQTHKEQQLYLILGEDAFASFSLWAKADRIMELCDIVIFRRPAIRDSPSERHQYSTSKNVYWMDVSIPDISATEIRNSDLATVRQNEWLHPNAIPIWEHYITTRS